MMDCAGVRPLLLEAEPEDLAGVGSSHVAAHVRTCGACGAVAARILDETARLDGFLARAPAAPDVDALVTRAQRREKKVIPFPTWKRWSAVAAAAAVAGLLFLRRDVPLQAFDRHTFDEAPLVEAAPDQNVAVLATANPDITVLWFF
jgi:predicted anti-sigma-YlaC factor YlaD